MAAYNAGNADVGRYSRRRRDAPNRDRAFLALSPAINDLQVIVGHQVHFISDSRVLTHATFKFAAEGLAEQHDRHPAITGEMKLPVIFERGTERFLRTAWRGGIGTDLRTYGVKVCVP